MTVIAGGSLASARRWKKVGHDVADVFLKKGWAMVYCGMGGGLAGVVATRMLKGGGEVRAVVVKGQAPDDLPAGARQVVVRDFHERQRKLFDLGDGALVLPGGSGTAAEFSTLVAWHEARLYPKSLVLFDPDDWFKPLADFYQQAWERRVIHKKPKALFARASSPTRIVYLLQNELV